MYWFCLPELLSHSSVILPSFMIWTVTYTTNPQEWLQDGISVAKTAQKKILSQVSEPTATLQDIWKFHSQNLWSNINKLPEDQQRPQRCLGLEHWACEQELRTKCLLSLQKMWRWGDLAAAPCTLQGDHQEPGARLFTAVCGRRVRRQWA